MCAQLQSVGAKQLSELLLIITVYRASWASSTETKSLCNVLDHIIIQYTKIIIDSNVLGAERNTVAASI